MDTIISQQHRDAIRLSLKAGTFQLEEHIQKLADIGVARENALAIIAQVAKDYKTELFRKQLRKNKGEEIHKVAFMAVFMINMIGPVFGVTSFLWYVVALLASGAAGYFAHSSKPVVGVVTAAVYAVILPFAYAFYFTGRTSYINIEILIPMVMAALPAVVVMFILEIMVPATETDD